MSERPTREALLAEYAAANSVYLTYDGFRWQAGSFLIAGVFVYWGFLINTSGNVSVTTVSSILVALLMSCWMLFANHYRQLYMHKLERMWEIERLLGMEQHLRFTKYSSSGRPVGAFGPRGHRIDLAVYVITSLGGSAITWARRGFSWTELLVVVVVAVVVAYVTFNESRGKKARAVRLASWDAQP